MKGSQKMMRNDDFTGELKSSKEGKMYIDFPIAIVKKIVKELIYLVTKYLSNK